LLKYTLLGGLKGIKNVVLDYFLYVLIVVMILVGLLVFSLRKK